MQHPVLELIRALSNLTLLRMVVTLTPHSDYFPPESVQSEHFVGILDPHEYGSVPVPGWNLRVRAPVSLADLLLPTQSR